MQGADSGDRGCGAEGRRAGDRRAWGAGRQGKRGRRRGRPERTAQAGAAPRRGRAGRGRRRPEGSGAAPTGGTGTRGPAGSIRRGRSRAHGAARPGARDRPGVTGPKGPARETRRGRPSGLGTGRGRGRGLSDRNRGGRDRDADATAGPRAGPGRPRRRPSRGTGHGARGTGHGDRGTGRGLGRGRGREQRVPRPAAGSLSRSARTSQRRLLRREAARALYTLLKIACEDAFQSEPPEVRIEPMARAVMERLGHARRGRCESAPAIGRS